MIALIEGAVISLTTDSAILMTQGGVGYSILLTRSHLGSLLVGQTVRFYTYLRVTEHDLTLFGFRTHPEKAFFEQLISVSGVGPKSAMNVLNIGSMGDIQAAISRGDVKYLTAVQGLGKKTAERLVVELKHKVSTHEYQTISPISDTLGDVLEALLSMGYGKEDVKDVVDTLDTSQKTTEELLKSALRVLAKKR